MSYGWGDNRKPGFVRHGPKSLPTGTGSKPDEGRWAAAYTTAGVWNTSARWVGFSPKPMSCYGTAGWATRLAVNNSAGAISRTGSRWPYVSRPQSTVINASNPVFHYTCRQAVALHFRDITALQWPPTQQNYYALLAEFIDTPTSILRPAPF